MEKFIKLMFNLPEPVYCEHPYHHWLIEPFNALSNVAFFIAAYFAYRLMQRAGQKQKLFVFLIWIIVLIGVGSTLFHTIRSPLTFYLDVVPIYIFILWLLFLLYSHALRSQAKAALVILAYAVVQVVVLTSGIVNAQPGLVGNLINLLLLTILLVLMNRKYHAMQWPLFGVLALFTLANVFRDLDLVECTLIHTGTHFLWHIFDAGAAYLGFSYLVKVKKRQG